MNWICQWGIWLVTRNDLYKILSNGLQVAAINEAKQINEVRFDRVR